MCRICLTDQSLILVRRLNHAAFGLALSNPRYHRLADARYRAWRRWRRRSAVAAGRIKPKKYEPLNDATRAPVRMCEEA